MNESNPYAAPTLGGVTQRSVPARPPQSCQVVFGISLLLNCMRLPFLLLDTASGGMGYDPALEPTIIPGIMSGAGIVIFGCVGNVLLLWRIAWGVPIAGLLLMSVAASIGVEIWITLIARSLPDYRATGLNDFLCIAVPLFRLVLMVAYSGALVAFTRWLINRGQSIQSAA